MKRRRIEREAGISVASMEACGEVSTLGWGKVVLRSGVMRLYDDQETIETDLCLVARENQYI